MEEESNLIHSFCFIQYKIDQKDLQPSKITLSDGQTKKIPNNFFPNLFD